MASNRNNNSSRPSRGGINGTLVGAVFLGVCILIAGLNIGGNLKKLNKTLSETTFSDTNTYNAPSDHVNTEKKYFTESEAAEYLNLSTDKIIELINKGEIKKYVKTDTGYSIQADVLDKWFDNEAYQNEMKADNPSDGQ